MNPFVAHPRACGLTYAQHWRFAMGVAVDAMAAGCAAFVHGFLPFLFEHTASRGLRRLNERIEATQRVPPAPE